MRNTIILMLCLATTISSASIKSLSLTQAIAKKLISVSFSSNGSLIGTCIDANYTNLTKDTLNITAENGTYLRTLSSTGLNVLITKRISTVLPKLAHKLEQLFALPTDYPKSFISPINNYEIAKNPMPESVKLCEMIDSFDLNCYTGQTAVAAFMNKQNNGMIRGAYIEKVNALRAYTAKVYRQKFETFGTDREFYTNPVYRPVEFGNAVTLGANGTYFVKNFNAGDEVKMEMYDAKGKLLKQMGYNFLYFGNHGLMIHDLAVSNLPAQQKYYVRLIHNNVLETEWIVDVKV
jgi:hypothetical protein